ncbi:hypothetical protein GOP47_0006127 [Adiantum capillus-veneris]|uniref:Two-component response regulator n=1 Tax=Adiantum capillus-veneris TaxID=13818 RepID=A0A9D4V2Z7_ADICA|nr:hypothetical protein GOP47_0006127 [Adiantum capillus-veneris]
MAMATTAHSFPPSTTSNSVSGSSKTLLRADSTSTDSFPAGLRVLVVDDDPICLLILDRMLRRCQYKVTTCGRATDALAMLRENRDSFDVIISDVYMPDMDGFKLLELVGLEMDLPVIMMSANGETSAVMKGIKHGACDYLLKPVRMEELRNIWQHVVRKKWRSSAQQVASEDDKEMHTIDDGDHNSSANDAYDGAWRQGKKRRDLKEDEEEADLDLDDPSTTKKPRVVWSVELHQQFVNAVDQLGIDKAVPKRILELMNVHGLTRENVASHLQKYRLYLKRISGVSHQSGTLSPSFSVPNDSSFGGPVSAPGLGGVGDFRALGAPNDLPSQALLSSLQVGALGRLNQANNLGLGSVEKSNLLQLAALQGAGGGALSRPPFLPSYGQPGLNDQGVLQAGQCDINPVQLAQMGALSGVALDKLPLGLSALQQQQLESAVGLGGLGQLSGVGTNFQQLNPNTNALLLQALQQQQQQQSGGAHLLSKSGVTIPTSGVSGQQGLSTDAGVWAAAISNLNGNIRLGNALSGQYGASTRLSSLPGTAGSGSAAQGPLGRLCDRECKGQQGLSTDAGVWGASLSNLNATGSAGNAISCQGSELLEFRLADSAGPGSLGRTYDAESKCSLMPNAGNVPLVNPLAVSSSMSLSGPDGLLYGRMKDINSSLPSLNAPAPQNLGLRFPGLKQAPNVGQRAQGSWQGFGGLGQDYRQVSLGCSSGGSSSNQNQGLLLVAEQEQGDFCVPGFNSGFANNFNTDSNSVKAFQGQQLRSENGLKVKNEGHGWIPEPLSDELLSIVLRQQQEGLGLTE